MHFFVDNLWWMLSGPTGHSNFFSPSCALVLVGLSSPGCHLVLFILVYQLCDDFLSLLCAHGPSSSCVARQGCCHQLVPPCRLHAGHAGVCHRLAQTLSAGPPSWRTALWSAPSSKENFKVLPSLVPLLWQPSQQYFLCRSLCFGRASYYFPQDLERWLPSLADHPT